MARYNHFTTTKYKEVPFESLAIGDQFGMNGNTFSTHVKTGELEYMNKKTKECKALFGTGLTVYIHSSNT